LESLPQQQQLNHTVLLHWRSGILPRGAGCGGLLFWWVRTAVYRLALATRSISSFFLMA